MEKNLHFEKRKGKNALLYSLDFLGALLFGPSRLLEYTDIIYAAYSTY